MIASTPPQPIRYLRDPLFAMTKRFKRALRVRIDDPWATLPGKLTISERIQVESEWMARKDPRHTRDQHGRTLEAAWNGSLLRVAAPLIDKPTEDLIAALRQPEARAFCARVISERAGYRSGASGLWFTLLVALVWGGLRTTPHIRHAMNIVLGDPRFMALGSELASSCEGAACCDPAPISYSQVTRLLRERLAPGFAAEAQITIAEIAERFAAWGYPVGRSLVVDGSLVPAWAQQKSAHINGKWSAEREARLRRRAPEAGFVIHGRGDTIDKAVRGYCNTTLTCMATGIVLTFDLQDASTAHEPRVLREILVPRMFTLMPWIEVDAIVGDATYDTNAIHENLETHYGIHPVMIRKAKGLTRPAKRFNEDQHPSVRAIRADGTAICRACGAELVYVQFEPSSAKRKQLHLEPGQPLPASAFRIRFECPNGCGKFSVAAKECWSNVPRYPRTPAGRNALYARRWALQHHRNQAESGFSSLQRGQKVSLDGAARTSVYSIEETEMLHSIAFLTRALFQLLAERMVRGELPA